MQKFPLPKGFTLLGFQSELACLVLALWCYIFYNARVYENEVKLATFRISHLW